MDEETIRLVKKYGLDCEAHRRESEWCRQNLIDHDAETLSRNTNKLVERISRRMRKKVLRGFNREYQKLKDQGETEYTDWRQQVNDGFELQRIPLKDLVYEKMKKVFWEEERTVYLSKMIAHAGLLKEKTRDELKGILGNLCAEACANLYHGKERQKMYETGFNALEVITCKQRARDVMQKWIWAEEKRIDDSFDI